MNKENGTQTVNRPRGSRLGGGHAGNGKGGIKRQRSWGADRCKLRANAPTSNVLHVQARKKGSKVNSSMTSILHRSRLFQFPDFLGNSKSGTFWNVELLDNNHHLLTASYLLVFTQEI